LRARAEAAGRGGVLATDYESGFAAQVYSWEIEEEDADSARVLTYWSAMYPREEEFGLVEPTREVMYAQRFDLDKGDGVWRVSGFEDPVTDGIYNHARAGGDPRDDEPGEGVQEAPLDQRRLLDEAARRWVDGQDHRAEEDGQALLDTVGPTVTEEFWESPKGRQLEQRAADIDGGPRLWVEHEMADLDVAEYGAERASGSVEMAWAATVERDGEEQRFAGRGRHEVEFREDGQGGWKVAGADEGRPLQADLYGVE